MHGIGAVVGRDVDMSGAGNHYYSIFQSSRDIKTKEHKTERARMPVGDSGPSSPIYKKREVGR